MNSNRTLKLKSLPIRRLDIAQPCCKYLLLVLFLLLLLFVLVVTAVVTATVAVIPIVFVVDADVAVAGIGVAVEVNAPSVSSPRVWSTWATIMERLLSERTSHPRRAP